MDEIRKEHPSATHIVYAYRVKDESRILYEKFSDAGEPSGTAGKPTLNLLQKQDIINGILITVRYFGGIKLGKGGLVRAYTESAKLALANATLREFVIFKNIRVSMSYALFESFEMEMVKKNIALMQKDFSDAVSCVIRCPLESIQDVITFFSQIGLQTYDIMD